MIVELRTEVIRIQKASLKLIDVGQPFYIFSDRQSTRKLIPPLKGIHIYGPYDSQTSSETLKRKFKGVEIIVVYPKDERMVENALLSLMEYMNNGYTGSVSFDGFQSEFRLKRVYIPSSSDEFIKYKVGSLSENLEEIRAVCQEAFERRNIPVIVIGGTAHKSSVKRREQYVEAKRLLTKEKFPTQYASYYELETEGYGILYQICHKRDVSYSLWNFSLNIYGKVGGLPWIIRQRTKQPLDISIGIRFARLPKGYVVGHAVILDSFGRLIGTVTSRKYYTKGMKISKRDMKDFFLKVLETAIKDPRIAKIYENGKNTLNVALHRVNLFHPEEILGVKEAVEDVKKSFKTLPINEIKIGFIGIIQEQAFFLLDESKETKNAKVGTCVAINDCTAIISTAGSLGDKERNEMIYPIIACCQNLDEQDCPFSSLEDVCKHIVDQTALHWQTIFPGLIRLPATLEFAEDVGRAYVKGINPPENSWLERTLWFI